MKPPRFAYARAETLAEVYSVLGEHGDDVRILAGGQSLMPMLTMRVARPKILLDINRVDALSEIRIEDGALYIGALTRHAAVESSGVVRERLPLLAMALPFVAHPAIRTRGTFGGSCALADPAAEIPACALALGARFIIGGPRGEREIPAADFFRGLYSTALGADEILLGARFPLAGGDARSGFAEQSRRQGDYAMAGVAAHGRIVAGRCDDLRLVFLGCGDQPVSAIASQNTLNGHGPGEWDIEAAIAALRLDLAPRGDLHASAALKMHLAGVLLRRVLSSMAETER